MIFSFDQLDMTLSGKVKRISSVAKSSGGITVVPVEFSFQSPPPEIIRPGLTCNVQIILREATSSFFVPKEAVRRDKNGHFVLKRTPEGPQKIYVKVGGTIGDKIEVKEGISEGDVLLLIPSREEMQRLKTRQKLPIFRPGGRSR